MTIVERLAGFVERVSLTDLDGPTRERLKVSVLDALGCAIGAMGGQPIHQIRKLTDEFGGAPLCTLVGGGRTTPDRAAFYNSALVRYLDFNDSYLAPEETCHPSDNLGAVIAATEYAHGTGSDLLTALGIAYEVQCRLSEAAPVRKRGFDHTTQGAYAVAAGTAKALGLNCDQIAHGVAIAGTALNALRVTRTGALSNWKGLAFPYTAWGAVQAVFLARAGITGPLEVLEGNKGFMEAIAGQFHLNWDDPEICRVQRVIHKKFNAEVHSQATLETVIELKREHPFAATEVEDVEIDTFDVAYHIIGGGEEGSKTSVRTKEQADHSLPYMVAAALLDDQVMPEQYRPERIQCQDIQDLLRRVMVRESPEFSRQFPDAMPCRVQVRLKSGATLTRKQHDYEGFHTRPMSWNTASQKFEGLAAPFTSPGVREQIIDTVATLETHSVQTLIELLARVRNPERGR